MKNTNRLIGYITLISVLVLLTFSSLYHYTTKISGWSYRVAYADDIGNLKIDNPIKINGIEFGRVYDISRENNKAKVVLWMQDKVKIRRDYTILNIDANLMGDRTLVLIPGFEKEEIPDTSSLEIEFVMGIAEGIRKADNLEFIVTDLMTLVKTIGEIDPNNDTLFSTKFKKILKGLNVTSLKLETLVLNNEDFVSGSVKKLSAFAKETNSSIKKIRPSAKKLVKKTAKLSSKSIEIIDKLDPLLDDLSAIVNSIEKGEGFLGNIAVKRDIYDKLIKTITKIQAVLKTVKNEGVGIDIDFF